MAREEEGVRIVEVNTKLEFGCTIKVNTVKFMGIR